MTDAIVDFLVDRCGPQTDARPLMPPRKPPEGLRPLVDLLAQGHGLEVDLGCRRFSSTKLTDFEELLFEIRADDHTAGVFRGEYGLVLGSSPDGRTVCGVQWDPKRNRRGRWRWIEVDRAEQVIVTDDADSYLQWLRDIELDMRPQGQDPTADFRALMRATGETPKRRRKR